MKIQIDLDPELWNRFRDVVIAKGQTLKEVVPTVFEPALRWYLHDPPKTAPYKNLCDKCGKEIKGVEFLDGGGSAKLCAACFTETLSPPPRKGKFVDEFQKAEAPKSFEFPEHLIIKEPPPLPQVKRCDLCDMPTERTFNHKGRKVCYVCWREGIINEGTKPD